MPTRKEQKENRRNEILMAALDLFIRKGFAGTRISDIAKAANMSTGLLFHYFESKEKLYEALIEYGASGPQRMMQLKSEDPITFFRTIVESIFGFIRENPFSAKLFILMVQATSQEPVTERIEQLVSGISNIQDTVPIIKRGQQLGQIRQGDPAALAMLFWGSIQGVAQASAQLQNVPMPNPEWLVDILQERKND